MTLFVAPFGYPNNISIHVVNAECTEVSWNPVEFPNGPIHYEVS